LIISHIIRTLQSCCRYHWDGILASKRGGREVVTDFAKSGAFHGYEDLLALGTASHEGKRGQEDARADRRAEGLANWIKAALSPEELRNIGVYSVKSRTIPYVTETSAAAALFDRHG
jgi:hypothetical protein